MKTLYMVLLYSAIIIVLLYVILFPCFFSQHGRFTAVFMDNQVLYIRDSNNVLYRYVEDELEEFFTLEMTAPKNCVLGVQDGVIYAVLENPENLFAAFDMDGNQIDTMTECPRNIALNEVNVPNYSIHTDKWISTVVQGDPDGKTIAIMPTNQLYNAVNICCQLIIMILILSVIVVGFLEISENKRNRTGDG